MALFEAVCDPETKLINAVAWERHANTQTPVGRCRWCGAVQLGQPVVRDWGRQYRDVLCRNDHEATIPGPKYHGTVIPGPEQLTTDRAMPLHLVPDPED